MPTTTTGKFQVTGWDETTIEEVGAGKVTRATATRTFTGDITGESTVDYLMAYGDDGSASFVGLERITGEAAGRRGSLVVQHVGRLEGGARPRSSPSSPAPATWPAPRATVSSTHPTWAGR